MFIPKRIFLYGILALIISLSYLPLYIRTRKAEELKTSCRKYFPAKLLLCYVFNILVSLLLTEPVRWQDLLFAFALMMILDFDLLICRIPTEFLALLYASILPLVITNTDWKYVLFSLVLWSAWRVVRRKKIIADHDIWMILPLMLYLNEIKKALLFHALFLILWGGAGLILHYFFRKKPDTKIPLVPLMVISFLLMQLVL